MPVASARASVEATTSELASCQPCFLGYFGWRQPILDTSRATLVLAASVTNHSESFKKRDRPSAVATPQTMEWEFMQESLRFCIFS